MEYNLNLNELDVEKLIQDAIDNIEIEDIEF